MVDAGSETSDAQPMIGALRTQRGVGVALGFALLVYVFAQNAWVAEDAYITFRSLEQLFAGNGLGWNPHERVQVYLHPLWFWVLAGFRLVSADVFANAITASFVAFVVAHIVLVRELGAARWLALGALLVSCKTYVDYTASGLENPLSALLLALLFVVLQRIERAEHRGVGATSGRLPLQLSLVFSLLLLSRLDLSALVAPAIAWGLWQSRCLGAVRLTRAVGLGLLPFASYLLFSLVYFGFLLPNPAYAKLLTGIPREQLVTQGLWYLASLRTFDWVLPILLVAALVRGLFARRPLPRAMALGVLLNVLYVVWIGGGFMSGRFLAGAALWSAILLVWVPWRRGWAAAGLAGVLAVGVSSSFSPLRSTPSFHYSRIHHQVGDERGIYFPSNSLYAWWTRNPDRPFPDHRFTHDGLRAGGKPIRVIAGGNIGMFGYAVGTEKIVLDHLALSDPLLARLPRRGSWRIGHFGRRFPKGYTASVRSGENRIEDPAIRALYEDLRLITQGELFTWERLAAIVRRNAGTDALVIARDYPTEPTSLSPRRPASRKRGR